jgi:hypothetical protein
MSHTVKNDINDGIGAFRYLVKVHMGAVSTPISQYLLAERHT